MPIVSIDWDFFIPEKAEWDLGHRESLMFLKMLWAHRFYLKDEMKVNKYLRGFWNRHPLFKVANSLFVSDSHAYAYQVAQYLKADQVILYDAHHDCWPKEKDGGVYCHDWGTHFRDQGGELIWVYPDDEQHKDLSSYGTPKDLKAVPYGSEPTVPPLAIHICRSGCWTPPWLDKEFIKFVKRPKKPITSLQDGDWDPLVERFSEADMKQAEEVTRQMEAFAKANREVI